MPQCWDMGQIHFTPAFEDGTDRVFRNVGIYKSDAGESPKRKQTRFFYFPSGGRHAEDFYVRKIQRLRLGLKQQTWVPEASMLTTRPPKPS